MNKPQYNHHRPVHYLVVLVGMAMLYFCLLAPRPAFAAFEGVGCFAGSLPGPTESCKPVVEGRFGEEVQLGGVGGMAVNYSGAGGVPAGTVYAATQQNGVNVAMFEPEAGGGLKFEGAWNAGGGEPYERCGLLLGVTCAPQVKREHGHIDLDVDQTTGNVYVYNNPTRAGDLAVTEFSADGSEIIARFGELTSFGKTTAETPEKIHGSQPTSGEIAVNGAGEVYVFDLNSSAGFYHRLMVFKPKAPGDFREYKYAGETVAGPVGNYPSNPVIDAAGHVYVTNEEFIEEYAAPAPAPYPAPPSTPLCTFRYAPAGITAITVNPINGEVFFFGYKAPRAVHRLGACDEATHQFAESESPETFQPEPERDDLWGLAFDPVRKFSPTRPAGVLYAGAPGPVPNNTGAGGEPGQSSLGYIFAPIAESPPAVLSESVSRVKVTSARLQASINPGGFKTSFRVQYLPESVYAGNEPDEVQALSMGASSGLFGLGFEGSRFGGAAKVDLTPGSTVAAQLKTATATATLSAAHGAGDLNGAVGKGTLIAGSKAVTSVAAKEGSFEIGQGISGSGIPSGATITAVATEAGLGTAELTISKPAVGSAAHANISSGTTAITSLSTSDGAFEVGQQISGAGIAPGTTIVTVGGAELTLSAPVSGPAANVTLEAGSTRLTAVAAGVGGLEVGRPIEGDGIQPGTTITGVSGSELQMSKPAVGAGAGVAVFDPGPYPLAVGEMVEGPGVSSGTTIAAVKAGQLTLSQPASASGTGVSIHAGLPFDVSAAQLGAALEGLPTIGAGGVRVNGGPGDETGSSPYRIEFTGTHENENVQELSAENITLAGPSVAATVTTLHEGGGGFDQGAAQVPQPPEVAGEGKVAVPVAVSVGGLLPDTEYRYRVVATSHGCPSEPEALCEGVGAAQAFHTYPPTQAGPPDGRAYELVSPAAKHGGQVLPINPGISSCGESAECKPGFTYSSFPRQSSPGGDAVVYEGSAFGSEGAAIENEYLARRGPSGWQSVDLAPPLLASRGNGRGYTAFDPQLNDAVLQQVRPALSPAAPPEYVDLYAQPSADPFALRPLLTEPPPRRVAAGLGEFKLLYTGASADLSRVFFAANDALTEEVEGVAPPAPEVEAGKFDLYEWQRATGQLRLVNVLPGNTTATPGAAFGVGSAHTISVDGQRAFFSDGVGQLYVRIDGAETRKIEDPGLGKFLSAATDGSKVLLTDGCLYDVGEERCEDLTAGRGGFVGLVGQSDDLSHVYFVDSKVLTGGEENENREEAEEGKDNLYAWNGGATQFVARLDPADNGGGGALANDWAPSPSDRSAQASAGGRYLAFLSQAPLTGYDSTGPCKSDFPHGYVQAPCPEVFLYDAATGRLRCPSCNPSGARALGWSSLPLISGPNWLPQPSYLTDSGRLYFDSQDSLSPLDTNEGVEDVYEWEPAGVGSCNRGDGCLGLISAGSGAVDSNFLAADASGKNVFFTTRDHLVRQDTDDLLDLYDAREGGGFASEREPPSGESPLQSPPSEPTPSSATFNGPGNLKSGCKRGQVKRKGKCVRKHGKHDKKHKHGKRHTKKNAHKAGKAGR